MMEIGARTEAFIRLGKELANLSEDEKSEWLQKTHSRNNWFTPKNTTNALAGIIKMLEANSLRSWVAAEGPFTAASKTVGVIAAGNLPAVCFHDLLCVLLAGHKAAVKLSSQDPILPRLIFGKLAEFAPELAENIEFAEHTIPHAEAFIATGGNNSARYFHQYLGKYPSIIRQHRSSVAVLDGSESEEDLARLTDDVISYYGLGCRNVSKLFLPENYPLVKIMAAADRPEQLENHKYANNYDYNKSILLVNGVAHLDNGNLLLTESAELHAPISVLFYEYYRSENELQEKFAGLGEHLQCVVGKNGIPFGQSQKPGPDDYADGINTLHFLNSL